VPPFAKQACGTDQEDEDDEPEDERRQVLALVRRQRPTQQAADEADREAAERGREQPVHPPDDDTGEHDDRVAEGEVGRDERVLDGQDHRHCRGQERRDEHGRADHTVRVHAQEPCGAEVHRGARMCRPTRAVEQADDQHEADGGDDDRRRS
jgi:hypothetical protein